MTRTVMVLVIGAVSLFAIMPASNAAPASASPAYPAPGMAALSAAAPSSELAAIEQRAAAMIAPDVRQVIAGSPAFQAALRSVEATTARHRQMKIGEAEWTGTADIARRSVSKPESVQSHEWELGIARSLRWPGKAEAFDQAGLALLEKARSQAALAWRETARTLLDRHGAWLRERVGARILRLQVESLEKQRDTVARRNRLGDAARVELVQAEAALAQAQAQAEAALGRARSAREALERQFPAFRLDEALRVPDPVMLPKADWIALQTRNSPEAATAAKDSVAAQAQMRLDIAQRRPDPSVGVRVGQAGNGSETVVGFVLAVPFPGEYRAAGAAASASAAAAADLQRLEVERRASAEAAGRVIDAESSQASWQRSASAERQLASAADGLDRAWQLGEGSIADALAARRLANEQRLATAIGAVDSWQALWRLALEAGLLWDAPEIER